MPTFAEWVETATAAATTAAPPARSKTASDRPAPGLALTLKDGGLTQLAPLKPLCPDITRLIIDNSPELVADAASASLETCVAGCEGLTMLQMSGCGLAEASIPELPRLCVLNLSKNQLTAFPSNLASHYKLGACILNHNQITTVPPLDMPALNTLVLSSNPLASLPPTLPETLTKLSLGSCGLTEFPNVALPHLKELRLPHNAIATLPDVLAATSLRILEMGHNRIEDLTAFLPLSALPWLHSLGVRGNPAIQARVDAAATPEQPAPRTADVLEKQFLQLVPTLRFLDAVEINIDPAKKAALAKRKFKQEHKTLHRMAVRYRRENPASGPNAVRVPGQEEDVAGKQADQLLPRRPPRLRNKGASEHGDASDADGASDAGGASDGDDEKTTAKRAKTAPKSSQSSKSKEDLDAKAAKKAAKAARKADKADKKADKKAKKHESTDTPAELDASEKLARQLLKKKAEREAAHASAPAAATAAAATKPAAAVHMAEAPPQEDAPATRDVSGVVGVVDLRAQATAAAAKSKRGPAAKDKPAADAPAPKFDPTLLETTQVSGW
ncbi:hypothetical protein CXG81DRAFT_21087 [Caulochytrium protostelioides]|uniref:L domain-like protein n=1 Tax=Caulochytrium protostelioides TaxID=1555241 RepID=A0A4P9WYZ5_9FUNG|nr:hypothetical protein CXG81DRAFT_21087 [Caulochytrium protostelioides]|eukprot:RKO98731.1 hypothetical protein CXG81DRAFT_21087 [Caulochytrium protostelioides]